jgi:predicted RNA-binding Zn ribbon-like protein
VALVVKGPAFELTGGDLALDFANTLSRRPTPAPREDLRDYADVVAWAERAKAIEPADADALRALAARNPRGARAALAEARRVREAIFETFEAVAGGRRVPPDALARVNEALAEALGRLRLGPDGKGWTWTGAIDFDRVLWPVARAAARLLTGPDRALVRECGASDCAWLFLDRSRNGARRWCDMAVCGNREKARRFQERARRRR